jgi:hypothetical protein
MRRLPCFTGIWHFWTWQHSESSVETLVVIQVDVDVRKLERAISARTVASSSSFFTEWTLFSMWTLFSRFAAPPGSKSKAISVRKQVHFYTLQFWENGAFECPHYHYALPPLRQMSTEASTLGVWLPLDPQGGCLCVESIRGKPFGSCTNQFVGRDDERTSWISV